MALHVGCHRTLAEFDDETEATHVFLTPRLALYPAPRTKPPAPILEPWLKPLGVHVPVWSRGNGASP